jgi:Na+/melibiose symporter-like transporter
VLSALRRILPPANSRALVVANLLSTVGTGMFVTGGVLFFTEAAGMSIGWASLLLMFGGSVGFMMTVPIGHLADRFGAREVAIVLMAARTVATGSLVLFDEHYLLWLAAMVMLVGDRGMSAIFGALTAAVAGPDRVLVQGYLRAVTNVGLSVGSMIAAPFLAIGGKGGYEALMLTLSGVLVLATLALPVVRRTRPAAHADRVPISTAMRDRRYVRVTVLHSVLSLQYEVVSYALPLWVVYSTDAPHWMIAVLIATNTALAAAFQVPVSARVRTIDDAVSAGRRSGVIFVFSTALLVSSHYSSGALTITLLVVAILVHTVGELWQASSAFLLSFELAPENAHGQYQGVFALGRGIRRAIAPGLVGTCICGGAPGLLGLGVVLALTARRLPRAVTMPVRKEALARTGDG